MNNSGQICQVTTLLGIVGPTCKSSYLLDWCNDGKCDADPKIDDD